MMKKIIALLMTMVLLLSFPLETLASIHKQSSMSAGTYTATIHDDGSVSNTITREYLNLGEERISLLQGQQYMTPAFVALNPTVLSYIQADVSVKDAEGNKTNDLYAKTMDVMTGYGRGKALNLLAAKPGSYTVTVAFSVPLTAQASGTYTEHRDSVERRKTYRVTVHDSDVLLMSLSLNANGLNMYTNPELLAYADMLPAKLRLQGIFEGIKAVAGLGVSIFLIAKIPQVAVAIGLTVLAAAGITWLVNSVEDYVMKTNTGVLNNAAETAQNVTMSGAVAYLGKNMTESAKYTLEKASAWLGFLTGAFQDIKTSLDEMAQIKPILFNPDQLTATLRLENVGPADCTVQVDQVTLHTLGGRLHFASSGNQTIMDVDVSSTLSSGESFEAVIFLYPEVMYKETEMIKQFEKVHEGSVVADCDYVAQYNGYTKEGSLHEETGLIPVMSNVKRSDMIKFAPWVMQDWKARFSYIMCPVTVELLNEQGEVLFTAVTDGEDVYAENGILMGSSGDIKLVSVEPDVPEGYLIRITAVDDGVMSILSGENREDGTVVYAMHNNLVLAKGDTFVMTPETFRNGGLAKLAQNGEEPIEPTVCMNEELLREALSITDVSDWAVDAVVQAILRGIVMPEGFFFQQEITVEAFARLLLERYEAYVFNPIGSIREDLEASHSDTPATDRALAMDLLYLFTQLSEDGSTPSYVHWNGNGTITRGEAAVIMLCTLEQMGMTPVSLYTTAYPMHQWADIQNGSDADSYMLYKAVNLMHTTGILRPRSEEPLTFDPDAPLTVEEALFAINAMDTLCRRMQSRNNHLLAILEDFELQAAPIALSEQMVVRLGNLNEQNAAILPIGVLAPHEEQQPFGDDMYANVIYPMAVLFQLTASNPDLHLMADELLALFSEDNQDKEVASTMYLYHAARGEMTTWDGSKYSWIPFSMKDEAGNLLNDEVYLYIGYSLPYLPEATASAYPEGKTSEFGQFLITDQAVVNDFLKAQSDLISRYDCTEWTPHFYDLLPGLQHPEVMELQKELKDRGFYSSGVDGDYGAGTEKSVKAFQKSIGVEETGAATQDLMELLFAAPRELQGGEKGSAVRKMRQALMDLGYLSGKNAKIDGAYDDAAMEAIKSFQQAMGLEPTGIADTATQTLLLNEADTTRFLLDWLSKQP